MKWLGVLFALFTVFASFGIGNMVQANSISTLAAQHLRRQRARERRRPWR